MSAPTPPRASARLAPAILLVALVAAASVAAQLHLATLRVPLNYNEGWNAIHAQTLAAGRALYGDTSPFLLNNYPPLSFVAIAAVEPLVGDFIMAGRLVAGLSFLLVTLNVGLTAATLARSRAAGILAGALFAGVMAIHYRTYVGMNDPQMLGHALMTTAMVLVVRQWRSRPALAAALVLALAAGLVKHNLIAFPIALVLAHTVESPRRGALLAATGVAAALAAGLVLYGTFGPVLFRDMLAPRTYALSMSLINTSRYLGPLALLLGTVLASAATRPERGPPLLLHLYAGVALVTAAFFVGGGGVAFNAFFDFAIAGAVIAGAFVVRVAQWAAAAGYRWLAAVLPLVPAMSFLIGFNDRLVLLTWDLRDGGARTRVEETARDVQALRDVNGRVACVMLALCHWAGKVPEVDFYNVQQAIATGRLPKDALLRRVHAGEFAAMALRAEDLAPNPYPVLDAETLRAVQERYAPGRQSSNGTIFTRPHADAPRAP